MDAEMRRLLVDAAEVIREKGYSEAAFDAILDFFVDRESKDRKAHFFRSTVMMPSAPEPSNTVVVIPIEKFITVFL